MKNINNEEYIGRKYNDLTIISVLGLRNIGNGKNRMFVRCVCDCGTVVECALSAIKSGNKKSCGCRKLPKLIKKICPRCNKEFYVDNRHRNVQYCSRECIRIKKAPNVSCKQCGKPFYLKPYRIKRLKGAGPFCSIKCHNEYKKTSYLGEGNHQYGLKGDLNASFKGDVVFKKNHSLTERVIYKPERVDCGVSGRIYEHRWLVEENWRMFPEEAFDIINGQHVLKKEYCVHHKDLNHANNDLSNLVVITRAEHTSLHCKIRYEQTKQSRGGGLGHTGTK